jgi:prepilin-type N-terminal cleavage/methylation domain-containing protein
MTHSTRRGPLARGARRRGYTLLEVILALAIGVLLLAALYIALDLQVLTTNTGRAQVQQSTVARQVINRLETDILTNLGPVDPKLVPSNSSSGTAGSSMSGGTTTTPATTTPTAGAGAAPTTGATTPASGTTTPTAGGASGSGSTTTNYFQFNLGVQGDTDWVALYVDRLPSELFTGDLAANPDQQVTISSLRRVTYWLSSDTGGSNNLSRQELTGVTSTDGTSQQLPPTQPDSNTVTVASNVRNITFEYYDGTTWQSSWDGTQLSTVDNKTPIGPPVAIRVTLVLAGTGDGTAAGADRTFRHVVLIQPANGLAAASLNTNASSSSSSSGSSSSSTTGN